MKTVLIAVDYDPTAQKVAEAGFNLAQSMGAEIILLHIVRDIPDYYSREYSTIMGFSGYGLTEMGVISSPDDLIKSSREYLEKIKGHLSGGKIHTVTREGDAAEMILKAAAEFSADIIVIGSHSRRGLNRLLMGSVAENVLRNSSMPLHIIPVREDD